MDETDIVRAGEKFTASKSSRWDFGVGGHEVRVEKQRPGLYAAFRPQNLVAFVDGKEVATNDTTVASGMGAGGVVAIIAVPAILLGILWLFFLH